MDRHSGGFYGPAFALAECLGRTADRLHPSGVSGYVIVLNETGLRRILKSYSTTTNGQELPYLWARTADESTGPTRDNRADRWKSR